MARNTKSDTTSNGTISDDDGVISIDTIGSNTGNAVDDRLDSDESAGTESGTESGTDTGTDAGIDAGTESGDPLSGVEQISSKRASGRSRQSSEYSARSGAGNRKAGGKSSQAVLKNAGHKALAQQLVGAHAVAGIMTGHAEICAISDDEAEALVEAVTNVLAQYKIKPNPKVAAWMSLIGVVTIVYAPKALAVRKVLKERAPRIAGEPVAKSPVQAVKPLVFS